ncbi:MAG: hypothetical protein OXB88_03950 [Bacteriovoracales bacterium]|nr:hypothetical protein [Bacteriovoracales bacterium]
MVQFPNIFVDPHYSYLLSQNLRFSDRSHRFIANYIKQHRGFHRLIVNSFLDVDTNKRIDFIVKTLGWKSFRDRLASVFIHYTHTNRFPEETNLQLTQDLIQFDMEMETYSSYGYSRSFLLAFYVKLCRIHSRETGLNFREEEWHIPRSVCGLMKKAKIKMIKIDWALLLLWHFVDYMGRERVEEIIDRGEGFRMLMDLLTDGQRDELYGNLLTYSYGIDDQDFFHLKIS